MAAPSTRIVPVHVSDTLALAARMRAADAAEVLAFTGHTPLEALEASVGASKVSYTLLIAGEVAAMFGVAEVSPVIGSPWLLTGDMVDKRPREFLRSCRDGLRTLLELYPSLVNAIDARYEKALRWAKWLGFEVRPAIPYGVEGLPFHPIWLSRETAHV